MHVKLCHPQYMLVSLVRYMSQVTYGILRICRVGFLRISERRSADVREPSAESSLVIRGIIAGYPRNYRWLSAESSLNICGTSVGHPRNVPLKVCAECSKEMD